MKLPAGTRLPKREADPPLNEWTPLIEEFGNEAVARARNQGLTPAEFLALNGRPPEVPNGDIVAKED